MKYVLISKVNKTENSYILINICILIYIQINKYLNINIFIGK